MGSGLNDKPESGMRTNKKLSSMALVFVLVMSSMTVPFVSFVIDEVNSFTAAPFTTTTEEGAWDIHGNEMTIIYSANGDTNSVTICGIEGGTAGIKILNVPKETTLMGEKYLVTEIFTSAFAKCDTLTTVDMPEILKIRYSAFADCTSLSTVNMPNVTTIDSEAFRNCTSLTTVNMPNVTTIGSRAFEGCTSLTAFQEFDDANTSYKTIDGVIFSKGGETLVAFPSGKGGEYTVPDDVTTISNVAFIKNEKLTKIVMPNVTTINAAVFQNCTSLTSVDMPLVTSIGERAFSWCTSLTAFQEFDDANISYKTINGVIHSADGTTLSIFPAGKGGEYVVDKGVDVIDTYAFAGCDLLKGINTSNVRTILNAAFIDCTSLTSADMPKAGRIAIEGFRGCTSLTYVNMPLMMSIGERAFSFCTSLTEFQDFSRNNEMFETTDGIIFSRISDDEKILVVFPAGKGGEYVVDEDVKIISRTAFFGCDLLETIDTSNVTTIEIIAFAYCSSLVSVNMPKVTTAEIGAFGNCFSLVSVNMPNVTTMELDTFYNCSSLTSVNMPKVTTIEDRAFSGCSSLTSVNMPKVTTIEAGAFENCTSLTSIDASKVTTILNRAFFGCSSLVSVNLPNVTSIGKFAFFGCIALKTMDMPNITTIGENAFFGCVTLTEFRDFDENNAKYKTIDGVIYSKDGSVLVSFPPGRCGEYTIDENVKVADSAFSETSLSSLRIPLTLDIDQIFWSFTKIKNVTIYAEGTGEGDVLDTIIEKWKGNIQSTDPLETIIIDCDVSSSKFDGTSHADDVILIFTENAKLSEANIETCFENASTMEDLRGNAYLWNEEDGIWKECSTNDEYEVFLEYDEEMGDVDRPVHLDQLLGLQELTFRALPNEGYEFVRWSNGSTDERLDIWVYDTTTVEAIFAPAAPSKNVDAPLTYDDIIKDIQNVRSSLTYVVDIDDLEYLVRLTPIAMSELAGEKIIKVSVTENGKEKYSLTFGGNVFVPFPYTSGIGLEYFLGGEYIVTPPHYAMGYGLDLLVTDDVSQEIKEKAEDVNRDMDIVYISTQQNNGIPAGSLLSYDIGRSGTYSLYVYDEDLEKFVDTGETVTADGGYVTIISDDTKIYALMTEAQEGGGDSDDDLLLYGAIAAVAIVALLGIILAWRRFKK